MEPREHDLLNAEARFLNDYCGEDALYRWWERLSECERERLARASNPVHEFCMQFVEALRNMLQALIAAIVKLLRAFSETCASAWAMISNPNTNPLGREAI